MNPCSECDGSGIDPDSMAWKAEIQMACPRCADMPWLPCPSPDIFPADIDPPLHFDNCEEGCRGRGRFKPDPNSVMWWCAVNQEYSVGRKVHTRLSGEDHDGCGWVARPQRLETVE